MGDKVVKTGHGLHGLHRLNGSMDLHYQAFEGETFAPKIYEQPYRQLVCL